MALCDWPAISSISGQYQVNQLVTGLSPPSFGLSTQPTTARAEPVRNQQDLLIDTLINCCGCLVRCIIIRTFQ